MARIEDIERRLLNWARWKAGATANPLGYAQAQMQERVDGEGWDAVQAVPTVDHEAAETDRGVQALGTTLQETLRVFYVEGGGIARKARKLGCTERAVYLRVEQAQRGLAFWLSELAESRKRERERVERLQQGAVVGVRSGR
jgi:hypothetical protein